MSMLETLGVLAHRGGLIARHPELTVGVVAAYARPTGLELELLARRPPDPRGAGQRQADIRAGRTGPPPAGRRLLPPFDEGLDLRAGWLDDTGRAHWEFGSLESSGDYAGFLLRTRLLFPLRYPHVSVALAWPEIGFPETVVDLALPDRATVERGTVSIWDAPHHASDPPAGLWHRDAHEILDEPHIETGRIVAAPRVLHRDRGAAVVLTRVTAVGALLSLEVVSVATRAVPSEWGASIAVLHGREAIRLGPNAASAAGGAQAFQSRAEFTVHKPDHGALDLLVSWPEAGLPEALAMVPAR
ncbi:hypothetical protein [Dactylosporangium sp. NPDC049140]|uniref:hypothetical protein n=1 Tax=Dactylosporangium sp. NPDC049140 TaxID=3155647 RepID=UPI0034108B42